MLNTLRIESVRTAGLKATLATLMLLGSGASMAASYELCATTGSVTMPGTNQVVTVLGYAAGVCPASVAAPGGPVLEATAGDMVTVTLHNALTESTGLIFQGQAMPPDLTGTANGGDKTYTFTPTNPGTYLYQAAPLTDALGHTTEHQTAMGLYGALIVRPAGFAAPFSRTDANVTTALGNTVVTDAAALASDVGANVTGAGIAPGTTILSVNVGADMTLSAAATADGTGVSLVVSKSSQAYAGAATMMDEESTLVLSEIDPALTLATAATFDMRDYAPKYFLINGKAFPETLPIGSAVGHKLLLRYVNAGSQHHSMATLGLRQNFIAKDGKVLPTADVAVTAETLAPGQTGDALIAMPAALAAASQFAVYDGNLKLHNSSDQKIGGMLTFVTADGSAATAGPVTSAANVAPNPANGTVDVLLTATITTSDADGVTAAEYFIDVPCKNGAGGIDMAASGTSPLAVSATINMAALGSLSSGNHTFYVHGQDAKGWGACTSVVLNLDKAGPTTSALALSPNPSSGSVPVALTGSASDVASGGANIKAFEYWVDAGAHTVVTLSGTAAPVRSLSASLPAPGTGAHTVSVRSQDALDNWGAVDTTPLTATVGGPLTSALSLRPGSANNGSYGVSSGQPVLRVLGTETSASATVRAAEGFIDGACPATTTRGFPFTPVDGAWGGASERVTSDIPLGTINNLSAGSHQIWVRGKDSTGAWGACVFTPLLIDKTAPTLTSGSISPASVPFGTATATLNFVAADTGGAGVAGVQYWFDSATAPANPKVAAGTTSAALSLAGIAGGNHTVYFRVRDAANNVSAQRNTPLTIVQAVNDARTIFASTAATPQTSDTSAAQRVLANDVPTTGTPRTAVLVSGLVRTSGTGTATVTLSCFAGTGNTAGTPVGGSTICTNGAYRVTLTPTGSTNAARAASKRGTYQFTYQMNRSGVLSNVATVTIRVQ